MKTEAQIQTEILRYLRTLGAYVVKTIATNNRGTPDILACYNGRFIGVEVKRENGRATELQKIAIQKIIDSGGIAGVCRSVEEVKALLEQD